MKTVTGKYGTAKIFTDLVEGEALKQVQTLMDCEFIKGQQVRMMPDIHAGAGCTVGTTIKLTENRVCPNLVGVDIGCGMLYQSLDLNELDLKLLDMVIHEYIPSGFRIHDTPTSFYRNDYKDFIAPVDYDNASKSLGTLGGGNHFIELDRDSYGKLAIVIHSGSRHLGLEVANYYQKKAIEYCRHNTDYKAIRKKIIEEYKAQGREKEIGDAIKNILPNNKDLPDDLCYLEDDLFSDYIHDMKLAQRYASDNRKAMLESILYKMDIDNYRLFGFESIHNYIDMNEYPHILRKGATDASEGRWLLIPLNMRDGTLLCTGLGNEDWNYSAPHGAGRLMSRNVAKKTISIEDFRACMDGIYSTSVCESTLDEAPQAYKPANNILENIRDTVEVYDVLKPVYNFKATDEGRPKYAGGKRIE